jgi:hypothetical protein
MPTVVFCVCLLQDGEPSPAQLWQEQLHKRAEELGAFVCLLGNMDKKEGDEEEGGWCVSAERGFVGVCVFGGGG